MTCLTRIPLLGALILLALPAATLPADTDDIPPLRFIRCIDEPLESIWALWTTTSGIKSFFAREGIVDARVDGEYSILFFPHRREGSRGAEGMRIVAIEPRKRLLITWNQPPLFPTIREQRALVEFRFRELESCGTEIHLTHFGWGQGTEWAAAREYFADAWNTVLNRLQYSVEHGPINWDKTQRHLLFSAPAR